MFTFSTAHLLNHSNTVEWSEDDKICLLTDKGAFIFSFDISLIDSALSLYPQKHFIPSPSKAFLTKLDQLIINNNDHPISSAEPLLEPIYLNDGFAAFYQKYQQASWSPATHQNGCILALLTYDCRLTLYTASRNEWQKLSDVSKLIDPSIKKASSSTQFKAAKQYRIKCMCWSNLYLENDSETCLLICATESGHFYFYKVKIDDSFEIKLTLTWFSELGSISTLKWFKTYLIICSSSGQVIVLRIPAESIDSSFNDFVMLPRAVIWKETDLLSVTQLACRESSSDKMELIFAKSRYFIIVTLQETSFARRYRLMASDPVIYEAKFKSTCTGLCFNGGKKFLYSSLDLSLVEVDYEFEYVEKLHLQSSNDVTKLSTSYGLVSSHNNVITCLGQTLARYHDHLVLKEPTRLTVFANLSFDALKMQIESLCFSNEIQRKSTSLKHYTDYFQALRGFYSSGNLWVPQQLLEIASGNVDCIEQSKLFNLRCLRFVILCIIYYTSAKQLESERRSMLEKALGKLEELIFDSYVKEILCKLSKIKHLQLTGSQSQSLSNLVEWSKKRNLSCPSIKADPQLEHCPICQAAIKMDNIYEANCPGKHKFGRCANSLLICDSFKVKYEKCCICGKHLYAIPYVWKEYRHCLYCSL